MNRSTRPRTAFPPPAGRTQGQWWAAALGVHLALFVLWEAVARAVPAVAIFLPAPSAILATWSQPHYGWTANLWFTALEIYGGFLLAALLGIAAAVAFSLAPLLASLALPLIVSLNMLPKVALGPLVITWLGYGLPANLLLAAGLAFFPILLTTARGLAMVEPNLLDTVQALRGSAWQVMRYVRLPSALPQAFAGMKASSALAVAGAIVGEFIASDRGLGYLMIQSQSVLDMPAQFMAVLLASLLGVGLYAAIAGLERLVLPSAVHATEPA